MAVEKKATILCIDDYENLLIGRRMVLETAGYNVLSSTDWRIGLQMFISCDIDEVILDNEMPGITGDVIASCMKKLKPAVPILLVSGDGSLPKSGLNSVQAFLPKVEAATTFLATVESLLNTSPIRMEKEPRSDRGSKEPEVSRDGIDTGNRAKAG